MHSHVPVQADFLVSAVRTVRAPVSLAYTRATGSISATGGVFP